jgi:hypothetical protein
MLLDGNVVPREGIEPPTDDYKSTVIPFNYQGNGRIQAPYFDWRRILGVKLLQGNFTALNRHRIVSGRIPGEHPG